VFACTYFLATNESLNSVEHKRDEPWCHVHFTSKAAAEKAWVASKIKPFMCRGRRLIVDFAEFKPRRILFLSRFKGDEDYIRAVFSKHQENIQWLKVCELA
jgi:hypothetical protein